MTKTDFLLMLTTVTLNASASLLVKKGAGAIVGGQKLSTAQGWFALLGPAVNPYTVVGIILLGLSFVAYIFVLSRIQLSVAQPMLAMSYIMVGVAAHFIFGESLSTMKVVGIGVIMVGVFLVSRV
ncbi:MAG: EamA family transporter [Patescibacteria group bacterium]